MRRVKCEFDRLLAGVRRVVALDDLASEWEPDLKFIVPVKDENELRRVQTLRSAGGIDVAWVDGAGLQNEDVVVLRQDRPQADVLYRAADQHHALFVTNRCNSRCLMCSQPPTQHDDSWLVTQAIEIVRHIKKSPSALGITGGEPLLLGQGLRQILDAIDACHPTTRVEVLSNGRLLSSEIVASKVLAKLDADVAWLIPLYGHADFVHDFVVQSPGAFEETIGGLLTLQAHQQRIQLRIVLVDPVLQALEQLCGFIGRNLPFVHEVALMACEPTGFAIANRDVCEVDLADWTRTLEKSVSILRRHEIRFMFMNTPFCALPVDLRKHAHRSISDWKNSYAAECDQCDMKASCSGLFEWARSTWAPAKITPIREEAHE